MSLEGSLEDLGLGDILQIVSLSRKSGVLTLQTRDAMGRIVFRAGEVICASSSLFTENLGYLLVNRGVIDGPTLDRALEIQKQLQPPTRLGEVLASRFAVPLEQIHSAVRSIVEKIIFSFFLWRSGTFSFALCEPVDLEVTRLEPMAFILEKGVNPQWLALEGVKMLEGLIHAGDSSVLSRDISELLAVPDSHASVGLLTAEQQESGGEPAGFNLGAELMKEVEGEVDLPAFPSSGHSGAALNFLRGMLQELSNPVSGGGVILLVLRYAAEIMNRAVVFLLRQDQITGLGQFGIAPWVEGADARIRRMQIPADADSMFRRVLDERIPVRIVPGSGHWDRYIVEQLGGEEPAEVFLAPIVSESKVVAIIYGDNLPERKAVGETEAFEIFISQAELAMDKARLERRFRGSDD